MPSLLQVSAPVTAPQQEGDSSAADSAPAGGSEFTSLAQAYGKTAEDADQPEAAAADTPGDAAEAEEMPGDRTDDATVQASVAKPSAAEVAADGDATSKVGSGKKETTP